MSREDSRWYGMLKANRIRASMALMKYVLIPSVTCSTVSETMWPNSSGRGQRRTRRRGLRRTVPRAQAEAGLW